MTDKSKRPLKKRHASFHQHQPTNRVNKFLAQAIEARSMGQEKSNHVHALTLCFRDSAKEEQVSLSLYRRPRVSGKILISPFFFPFASIYLRLPLTVSTGCRQQFRQFVGLQFGPFGIFGWRPAGRLAADSYSPPLVPDGLCVDGRPAHDALGCPAPLAPLGCDPRIRLPAGHHRLYNRPPLCRRSSQRGLLILLMTLAAQPAHHF